MMLKQVMEICDLIESATICGETVRSFFSPYSTVEVSVETCTSEKGKTDFVRLFIPGSQGKRNNGSAPTLGVIGRLGGIGARPQRIGNVSDADGAIAALAIALKLASMGERGDQLLGDVLVTTHICPDAPTQPHFPVDFMDSPVDMEQMNKFEVDPAVDAYLSFDATKGNRIINTKGFAISPTVKEGYILRVSDDLVQLMEMTSGKPAVVFPLSIQDITPYANHLYHLNSILQPACATSAPVVGVATTAQSTVPGCATGANHEVDIADAARFGFEVAKAYTAKTLSFYDETEYEQLITRYGSLRFLQTTGK